MSELRVIATVSIGEQFQKMAAITHPFMQAYAKRCNAEFVVFSSIKLKDRFGQVTYEKFQLEELLKKYSRVAFIDTDILIAPDAPSVFDLVPYAVFAASSEEGYSQSDRHKMVTQEILGPINWKNVYFNSGVMVFSRAHESVFDTSCNKLVLWATGEARQHHDLSDQPYLNYRVNELDCSFMDLGFRFNHTRVIRDTKIRFRSYFIHYAGPSGHRYGTRIEQLTKDSKVLKSPFFLQLSRTSLFYRWIADRIDVAFLRYLFTEKLLRKIA